MTEPVALSAIATAPPPHTVSQADIADIATSMFNLSRREAKHLKPIFDNVGVATRQICEPIEFYLKPRTFTERNDRYRTWATELGAQSARRALAASGVSADDVGSIIYVSTTGLATPSIDVALMRALGVPAAHTHRESMFGRGCAGGVAGLAQAADRVRLSRRPVLLVVAELCSLTFRRRDRSRSNLVSTALFGDGVAAAVLGPTSAAQQLAICDHDAVTWPDTESIMGWDFGNDGMTVRLGREIPSVVEAQYADSFNGSLKHLGFTRSDITHTLVHPGSAVVLDAVQAAVGDNGDGLSLSRAVLRQYGNMSAATILYIMRRFLDRPRPASGRAMISALGPGFTAEHVVASW